MHRILIVILALVLSSCVVHRLEVVPIETTGAEPVSVATPVKAHLKDGSTVVFENGISVANGKVTGVGQQYDLSLKTSVQVTDVLLDDIAAMESFQTPVSTGATSVASAASGFGILFGVVGASMLIFGSCPTIYSFDGVDPFLEAETFSYSIAPSFQSRDIDRLGVRPTTDNRINLELRNEMLETHYIDHLQLLEISHDKGQHVYPDETGAALVVSDKMLPIKASDSTGRDILADVIGKDDKHWRTPEHRFASVTAEDTLDHLDIEFNVAPGIDEVALLLRMRNSLLSTVLFYDVMLKQQNFAALEWMGKDLDRLGNKIELGLWYRKQMGATVSVWRDGRYRKVARLGDQGPIAWSERAVRVPTFGNQNLKVRISFVADAWRIDQVAAAENVSSADSRTISLDKASGPDGDREDILEYLNDADETYLITKPQDWLALSFDVGPPGKSRERTYFLASEGYYMEWMRADWLQHEKQQTFVPGSEALQQAIEIWSRTRDDMREQFDSIKLAVR